MLQLVPSSCRGNGFLGADRERTGAFAAGFSTFITAPFDTIKTRRQISPSTYTGILQTTTLILQQEGSSGLFRGVALRCARKAASSGIAWSLVGDLTAFRWNAAQSLFGSMKAWYDGGRKECQNRCKLP
jgi:hypothetical protein